MHQTRTSSYTETLVQSQHPPLIDVPSPATDIPGYLVISNDELESERDSIPTNPIPGASTPPRNTSTSVPAAHNSSKTACGDEVPETTKLDHESHYKREREQTQHYSEHGFGRLVVVPTTFTQAMASIDADL